MADIRVLLVEDDPMVREVNRQFIERVRGFQVIDTANNGITGIEKARMLAPDLVIMDIFMPEQDGLETLRQMRQEKLTVDCISVTAANDVQTIQDILHLGVFDYIMKPFTFERMEHTLKKYLAFKANMQQKEAMTQQELDAMMGQQQTQQEVEVTQELPKGFNKATLHKVLCYLQREQRSASADDVAAGIGVARVTARRYLDYMEKNKLIKVDVQYGSVGRPVNQYYLEH